jgi:non-homologous end joining protein Ku
VLYFPAQLRGPAALEAELGSAQVSETEARLAEVLVEAYSRPVRWADYRDDSAERLAALVEAKLRGQQPPIPIPEQAPPLTLLDALRQSVAALQTPPAPQAAPAAPGAAAKGKRRPRRTSA